MGLSSLVSRVIPTAIGFVTGGPVGATTALIGTEQAKREEKKIKNAINQRQQQEQILRSKYMAMGSGEFGTPGLTFSTPQPQQLGFFDRLGGIASNVGNTLLTGLESAIPSLINRQVFGTRPQSAQQGPALTTITNVGAQESQGSGSIQAGAGSLLAPILSGARNLLKTPQGQLALGGGGALLGTMFGGEQKGMRITRKMKSQARMVLNMTGGNLSATADMLGIDQNTLVMILLKRFRNDGPVVTKAALRKTKQTIRRLHSMQDVLKSITPTATMRRRAPMKRATTTTLIKN
jgi:hypothetical protein